jgi:hypothetical protein
LSITSPRCVIMITRAASVQRRARCLSSVSPASRHHEVEQDQVHRRARWSASCTPASSAASLTRKCFSRHSVFVTASPHEVVVVTMQHMRPLLAASAGAAISAGSDQRATSGSPSI